MDERYIEAVTEIIKAELPDCNVESCTTIKNNGEVKWALGSITMNKTSGGDGIPAELYQILKNDAVKVLHSICQQIWKIQQ